MQTTEEIKSLIHESIENIDDLEVLAIVKDILERTYTPEQGFRLSPAQGQLLDEAWEEVESGEFLSNEQANALVEEWQKK